MDATGKNDKTTEKCLRLHGTKLELAEVKEDNDKLTALGKLHTPSQATNTEKNIKSTSSVDHNITNISISAYDNDIKSNKEPDNDIPIPKVSNHKSHSEKEKQQNLSAESDASGENKAKDQSEDTVNELVQKEECNLKRKHRNASLQETNSISEENGIRTKRKKFKAVTDKFCWRCHKESVEAHCSACPRSWHRKCMGGTPPLSVDNWICGECATILRAENAETRSTAMSQLSVDQLCMLLKHVVQRMRDYPGSEPFWKPVETMEAPNYFEYVVKPMDLSLLESNVRAKLYGSTDAFMADAKWIQHNCIVFNTCGGVYTDTSKLTNAAKQMIKLSRQEVSEIEACPDCYAHGRNLPRPQPSWFIEPCSRPHPLVWAKLKGFPFWPAKAMPRVNSQGYVDVRFFGEHDRAWVSPRDLYLYSQDPPTPLPRKRKMDMDECVREITRHCRKLELVFGQFKFAPPKVQYNPHDPMQIKLMLPYYDPLQPTNFLSSQFLTAKKRMLLRKRGLSLGKIKVHNDLPVSVLADVLDSSTPSNSVNSSEKKIKVNNTGPNVCKVETTESNKAQHASPAKIDTLNRAGASVSPSRMNVINDKTQTANETSISLAEDKKTEKNKRIVGNAGKGKLIENGSENETIKPDVTCKERAKIHTTVVKHIQKTLETSSRQKSLSTDNLMVDITSMGKTGSPLTSEKNLHKESSVCQNNDFARKSNTSHGTGGSTQKVSSKSTKGNMTKVYKPKTRMVDKVNAEEALKSVFETKTKEKSISSSTEMTGTKFEAPSINTTKTSTKILKSPPLLVAGGKIINVQDDVRPASAQSPLKHLKTDESVALLLVVNNEKNDISKLSSTVVDSQTGGNVLAVIKQEPKDNGSLLQKKESRARKSLPNKPPNYPQYPSHACKESIAPPSDSILYIPAPQNQSCVPYQMMPPEAGPLSAGLYSSAQKLARKMAQLMEEAYKEVAEQNSEDEIPFATDNQRATVHFLRLQIERMRWQHQQQVAELKHNADRILREMRCSLEAERLRAIEETRRVAEEEKIRSIEETKRKQWCAMCGREALFYCCWNTAYCDYPCQQSHWPTHMRTCAQQPSFTAIVTSTSSSSTPLQQSRQEQQHRAKQQPQQQLQQQMQSQQQTMPRLVINAQHATANLWSA